MDSDLDEDVKYQPFDPFESKPSPTPTPAPKPKSDEDNAALGRALRTIRDTFVGK